MKSTEQKRTNNSKPPVGANEQAFIPPEAFEQETSEQPIQTNYQPSWKQANIKQPSRMAGLNPRNWSKKQTISVVVVSLILLGGGASAYAFQRRQVPVPVAAPVPAVAKAEEPAKPTTVASTLTGLQVNPDLNNRPVIGVMIENSPEARPQSGLNQAGVVFEAIAEGGITRFLTLWQDTEADYVGPVRSVRMYYLQWAQGFDAPIAHAGGAADALAYIKSAGIKDLDQFANAGPYSRVTSRYAPHNLYTDITKLRDLSVKKGWSSSTYTGFARKKAEAPAATPTATSVDLVISGVNYNVHYDYDQASNSYKRVMAGKPHTDERSKTQLSPKVVVALVVPYNVASNGIHSNYKTIGSGKAYVFQDGSVTEGVWEKTSPTSQITFGDANGAPLPLTPGQTWITAVGAASNVSFK